MFSTRARVVTAALTAITMVVLADGIAHAEPGLTVSLTVDDQTTQVTTTASTVGALLTEQNISTDSHDLINPAPITTLTGGDNVVVTHTEPVHVRRASGSSVAYVSADTFGDAVVELGIYPQTYGARAGSFPRHEDRTYLAVGFRTPTGAQAKRGDALQPDSVIKVDRVRLDYSTHRKRIHRAVHRTRTPLIPAGRQHVVKRGHYGARRILNVTKYINGHVIHRHVVTSRVVRHPSARIIQLGTGPNWYGLARCESGGSPHAVNPAGYYGLYQFSISTWHSVGGKGIPTEWGWREQTYRAWLLYKNRGRAPWPVCGAYL